MNLPHWSVEVTAPPERVLEIVRLLDEPLDAVWKAWTEPRRLKRWWGPIGFTTPQFELDLRPGGYWSATLRPDRGPDLRHAGIVIEVVPHERLVMSHAWLDEDGKSGEETVITVSFREIDGKTELRFRQAVFESSEERDSHEGGWSECFDMLVRYLAGL